MGRPSGTDAGSGNFGRYSPRPVLATHRPNLPGALMKRFQSMMAAAAFVTVAAPVATYVTPQSAVTWLVFVDDLHLDFRNTGRLRDLLGLVSSELIQDERPVRRAVQRLVEAVGRYHAGSDAAGSRDQESVWRRPEDVGSRARRSQRGVVSRDCGPGDGAGGDTSPRTCAGWSKRIDLRQQRLRRRRPFARSSPGSCAICPRDEA